jgi:Family of unknown function (DUF6496)
MPEKRTLQKARSAKRRGKSPSTQAGAFVEEEIHHVREGKHGARSTKQAIAIGLSKARRSGVKLPPPRRGQASSRTRKQAQRDSARARRAKPERASPKRARASERALKKEGRQATSRSALSRHARRTTRARNRTRAENRRRGRSR